MGRNASSILYFEAFLNSDTEMQQRPGCLSDGAKVSSIGPRDDADPRGDFPPGRPVAPTRSRVSPDAQGTAPLSPRMSIADQNRCSPAVGGHPYRRATIFTWSFNSDQRAMISGRIREYQDCSRVKLVKQAVKRISLWWSGVIKPENELS